MAHRLTSILDSHWAQLLDFIWPRITGGKETRPQFQEQGHSIAPEMIDAIETILSNQMTQSENRMTAVDRKLLSLFRLTSLLATLVIALLAGAAGLISKIDQNEQIAAGVAIILILYTMLQLILAVRATISGLEASRYASQTKETILPLEEEHLDSYRNRQIRDIIYVIEQHQWATNSKVSHMQVAYRAIRNTIVPIVGLIASATYLAYLRIT